MREVWCYFGAVTDQVLLISLSIDDAKRNAKRVGKANWNVFRGILQVAKGARIRDRARTGLTKENGTASCSANDVRASACETYLSLNLTVVQLRCYRLTSTERHGVLT